MAKEQSFWLLKSEPDAFSLDDFIQDKRTIWDGVRSYHARNYLKIMQLNDLCLFYRSVLNPAVVALAKVTRTYFQDPTTDNPAWVAIEIELIEVFKNELSLITIKEHDGLKEMALTKNRRLSVQPVEPLAFEIIYNLCTE